MRINELVLYRNFKYPDILNEMAELDGIIHELEDGTEDDDILGRVCELTEKGRTLAYRLAGRMVELAYSHGYEGNLWQAYLTHLIANNENAFSKSCEIRGASEGSLNNVALHDFTIFRELFAYDFTKADRVLKTGCMEMLTNYTNEGDGGKTFNKRVRDRICELSVQLAKAADAEEFYERAVAFYKEFGVGKFGLHKAFRIEHDGDKVRIEPITNIAHVKLDDLVGYEIPKQKLIDNTEAFINGKAANNCLLFGDAGTGKSSSIKGILNEYYDRGLRIIEVYKHQFKDLNEVIAQIKDRNYKFILYMDDLSFEDFEIEYKYLKAVIEGGLEKKPKNILIYATSNRRHIVREKNSDKNDRDEDLHTNDTVQEKLSLAYRFGVSIYFSKPDKKQFNEIVLGLAKRNNIAMEDDELLLEANKWELSHGGMSGRCAQQFIDYMSSRQ